MSEKRFRPGFRITEHQPDGPRDVGDEIAFHLAMRERELIASGMDAEEARRVAREAFGDQAAVRDECLRIADEGRRSAAIVRVVGSTARDVRHALRVLGRSPLFALVSILTLALGIGGNAVVFSLVEAVLLRAPAVRSPDRLATVWTTCRAGDPHCSSSYPDFLDYRSRSTRFADMAAYTPSTMMMEVDGAGDVIGVEHVSGNYFGMLGVRTSAGRLIEPADEEPSGDAAVAVLSERYWRTRLGADPGVVGRNYRIDGVPHVVIGVAARGYDGLVLGQVPDAWIPLAGLRLTAADGQERLAARGSRWIGGLVARLADGATIESARAELLRISDELALEDPEARGPRKVTVEAMGPRVGQNAEALRSFLGILQGAVLMTLLLACANLANLLLARATARRAEMGVRLALGIGRRRLIGQLVTENVVLAAIGGVCAVVVCAVALRLIGSVRLPGQVPIGSVSAGLNPRVLLFVTTITVLSGVLFGLTPALVAMRADLAGALKSARGDIGTGARLRSALVGLQIAIGVVLVVGASLFVQTVRNRLDVDLGFPTHGLAVIQVDPSIGGYPADRTPLLLERLFSAVESVPGVASVGAGRWVPARPGGSGTFVTVDGYVPAPDEEMRVSYNTVSRGFLRTLGLPVVSGIGLDAPGSIARENAVVIDENMARRWWPDRDAVGGTIHASNTTFTVVGVARPTAWGGIDIGTAPFMFVDVTARPTTGPVQLLVRTEGDASSLIPSLVRAIQSAEPQLGIRSTTTIDRQIALMLAPQITAAWLLSFFGFLASALAVIGIWGVVAYTVTRRQRDTSIRLALGASRAMVVQRIARGMVVPIILGIAAGVLGARALSLSVGGFMFGITGTEPSTYVGVALAVAIVAAAATLVPARRAAAANPVEAMRAD